MPTILIKEVRQKRSLCLVGSLEFTPSLSPQASSLFFHILPSPGVRVGGECENPWPQARICDASGGDDAHPNFSLLRLPQHGAALAESKVLFLNKTTPWGNSSPPLYPTPAFPQALRPLRETMASLRNPLVFSYMVLKHSCCFESNSLKKQSLHLISFLQKSPKYAGFKYAVQ